MLGNEESDHANPKAHTDLKMTCWPERDMKSLWKLSDYKWPDRQCRHRLGGIKMSNVSFKSKMMWSKREGERERLIDAIRWINTQELNQKHTYLTLSAHVVFPQWFDIVRINITPCWWSSGHQSAGDSFRHRWKTRVDAMQSEVTGHNDSFICHMQKKKSSFSSPLILLLDLHMWGDRKKGSGGASWGILHKCDIL